MTLGRVSGGAALPGIGFTVSLFVTDLAFDDEALRDEATVGVLAAAVARGAAGLAVLPARGRARRRQRRRGRAASTRRSTRRVDHIRGPVDAPLTLVEYGDMECPFCGRATGVVAELRARSATSCGTSSATCRSTTSTPTPGSPPRPTEAAGAQGRFWEMHDRLFADRTG